MRIKNDEDFGAVLVCAVRYALGRKTYMPGIVAGFVKSVAGELSVRTLTAIRNDVRIAKGRDMLGDENFDAPAWMDLLGECDFLLAGGVRGEDESTLGGRIKSARKRAGLTQKQLSEMCGISGSYLCGIERGLIEVRPKLISEIAHALGVPTEHIMCEGGKK